MKQDAFNFIIHAHENVTCGTLLNFCQDQFKQKLALFKEEQAQDMLDHYDIVALTTYSEKPADMSPNSRATFEAEEFRNKLCLDFYLT